jgi:hypothetical protein
VAAVAGAVEVEVVEVVVEVVEAVAVSAAEAGKFVGISLYQKASRIPSKCLFTRCLTA